MSGKGSAIRRTGDAKRYADALDRIRRNDSRKARKRKDMPPVKVLPAVSA